MATKSLLLVVPASLCFLLVLGVTAQHVDDISFYAIIVNGTVTCSGNSSADLQYTLVNVRLEDTDTSRSNLRVWQQVGYGYTDSAGKFDIRIPFGRNGNNVKYWNFPQFIKVEAVPYPVNPNSCPSGFMVEAYAKSNTGGRFARTSNGTTYFAGVHILPNDTRSYFEEYIK